MSIDDIKAQAEERMGKALSALHENFSSVRTGRANAMALDRIKVDYYGVPTPVNQMAGVKTPDAHMLVIEPWDKTTLKAIEKAILESDLGVTPSNDGTVIRLPFPALTEESRRELRGREVHQGRQPARRRAAPRRRCHPEDYRQVHRRGRRVLQEEGSGGHGSLAPFDSRSFEQTA